MQYSITYALGTVAKTNEFQLNDEYTFTPLNNQLKMSVPVITSATIHVTQNIDSNLKNDLYKIYIGKEFDIDTFIYHEENYQKYNIEASTILKLMMQGYKRFCLLNYKRYDQVVIGLKDNDKVVSDYFALKTNLSKIKKVLC